MSRTSNRPNLVLTEEHRQSLKALTQSRTASLRKVERAKILLGYADGLSISAIGTAFGVSRPTIYKCLDKVFGYGR